MADDLDAILRLMLDRHGEERTRQRLERLCLERRKRGRAALDVARDAARIAPPTDIDRAIAKRALEKVGLR